MRIPPDAPFPTIMTGGGRLSGGSRGQDSSVAVLARFLLASFGSAASLSRAELEERTGLSRHVVADIVAALLARGELVETRHCPPPEVRGRPPVRYARAALQAPVLLIRLRKEGLTSVTSVCADGAPGPEKNCAPWSASWEIWSRSVADASEQVGARPRLAVLSVPFPVAEGRRVPPMRGIPEEHLTAAGRTTRPRSSWLEHDPRPTLSESLGYPALMVNDSNLAALGEARFGTGRGMRAVMHVSVMQGIGAGLVVDGELFTGAHGFSGELAHVQVTPDGAPCVCGNRGCLATVLRLRGGEAGPGVKLRPELGTLVGQVLAPFITAFDPDCVVTDARLGSAGAPFIAGLTAELIRRCPPPLTAGLTILAGGLDDAEMYGALAAADAHAITRAVEATAAASLPAVTISNR